MAFDQIARAPRGLRNRINAGLSILLESVQPGREAETREAPVFLSAGQSLAAALREARLELPALAAQAWVTQLASAARTATTNGPDQLNDDARGLIAVLDLTAFVTAASLRLALDRKNADGSYTEIALGPILAAVNRSVVLLDPLAGAEPAGVGDSVDAILPNEWRIRAVHGNANSHTYGVATYAIR